MTEQLTSGSFTKDPDAKLDYGFDFTNWLPSGDTISTSSWSVATGLTESSSPAPSTDGSKTTVWLEGGTVGQQYLVTNSITTTAGRKDDRTMIIVVKET